MRKRTEEVIYCGGVSGRGVGKILGTNKSNVANWIKKSAKNDVEKCKTLYSSETVELDELYWFLERKPRTETRENIYIMTMVSREPRQIVGHVVSVDKPSRTIQQLVDAAPQAKKYCTDGYSGYLDVFFPGKHIFNIHNKSDTFTVEGVNVDLRHYIPALARRSRCFPRKLENLQAVLLFSFVLITALEYRKAVISPVSLGLLSLFHSLTSFNSAFGHFPIKL